MTRTGLNIHRTAKPRAGGFGVLRNGHRDLLRGPILPMRAEDAVFWNWREARKPRGEWYGRR